MRFQIALNKAIEKETKPLDGICSSQFQHVTLKLRDRIQHHFPNDPYEKRLTLRSRRPFSRFTSSKRFCEWPLNPSCCAIAITVPASLRHRVILAEQRWHNQKYSGVRVLDTAEVALPSSQNSSPPSARSRNGVEHEELVHVSSIAISSINRVNAHEAHSSYPRWNTSGCWGERS